MYSRTISVTCWGVHWNFYTSQHPSSFKMFTANMANIFVFLNRIANIIGSSPFRINSKGGKVVIHLPSHFRVIHFSVWMHVYGSIVLPTHLYILYTTGDYRKCNFVILVTHFCFVCDLFCGVFAFKTLGVCQFLNGMFKFLQDFEAKYMTTKKTRGELRHLKFGELFLSVVVFLCLTVGVMAALDCCIRPHASVYLLFNVSPRITPWWAYLIACGWYSSFAIGFTATMGVFAYIGVMFFVFSVILIRSEFRWGCQQYKSKASLRKNLSELVTNWHALEILMKVVNTEVMFCVLFFQSILRNVVVFASCTLLYHWSSLGNLLRGMLIFVSLAGPGVWCIFLILGGLLFQASEITIASWHPELCYRRKERQILERSRKACKPFSLGDGKRYFIQPNSFPKFIYSLSKSTFRSLITYGNVLENM